MARVPISAVLWRRVNDATVQSLAGNSSGQYHITLGKTTDYRPFFVGVEPHTHTPLGGFTLDVPIAPFEGARAVQEQRLTVRYMGPDSKRQDWNIPSQRPDTAYPLWRIGRGLPARYQGVHARGHFIIVARDNSGRFHARWLQPDAVERLPDVIRDALTNAEFGAIDLEDFTDPPSLLAQQVIERLERSFNVLLYGPPGTGKTHVMQEVMRAFGRGGYFLDTAEEHDPITAGDSRANVRVGWVTFHQSYSYEEFVVGLRPQPGSAALLNLAPQPGLLLELAAYAEQPGQAALLVIDEINRGNTSRIFGEFITLLEADKRLGDDGEPTDFTVPVNLPYLPRNARTAFGVGEDAFTVENPFRMPRRLYVLASMNSVDKSVAPLDAALRRRFDVVPLLPDLEAMTNELGVPGVDPTVPPGQVATAADVKHLALALIAHLNRGVGFLIGSEYAFGHWYLAPLARDFDSVGEAAEALTDVWNYRLLPQLEELFGDRAEQLAALLRLDEVPTPEAQPLQLLSPPAALAELGADAFVARPEEPPGADALLAYFLRLLDEDEGATG